MARLVFPTPPGPGEGDEPGADGDQAVGCVDVDVAADERPGEGGEIARCAEAPDRRGDLREPIHEDLEQVLGLGQVLQPVPAEVPGLGGVGTAPRRVR